MTTTAEVLHRLDAALYRVGTDPTGLAALRRGAGRTPMDLPGTWPVLLPVVHDAPWAEEAVHHALTLYSVHQQSVPTSMHKPGVGLGAAARQLRAQRDGGGIDRRLLAAASAASTAALAQHLRGLVTLLRGERLPLDYLQLTRDLLAWPDPQRASVVRRRWARDLYATSAGPPSPDSTGGDYDVAPVGEPTSIHPPRSHL
jgi:CRISPR system Cascade subunit CasB